MTDEELKARLATLETAVLNLVIASNCHTKTIAALTTAIEVQGELICTLIDKLAGGETPPEASGDEWKDRISD